MADEDNRRAACSTRKQAILIAATVILVLVVVIVLGFLFFSSSIRRRKSGLVPVMRQFFCESEECIKQSSRILENMDESVDPCSNFYNFTCGNFMRTAVIPGDQTRLLVVLENSNIIEQELLDSYNSGLKFFITPIQEIKKFYFRCIGSKLVEKESIQNIIQIILRLKWPLLFKKWNVKYSKKFNWINMEATFNNLGLTPVFFNTRLKYDMRNFSAAYIGLDCTPPNLVKDELNNGKIEKTFKEVMRNFMKMIGKNYRNKDIDEIFNFFLDVEQIKPTNFEMSDANFFNSFKTIRAKKLEDVLNIKLRTFLKKILPSSVQVASDTIIGTNTYDCLINMANMLNNANKRILANYMVWVAVQDLFWVISTETRKLDLILNRLRTGVEAEAPLYKLCLEFIDEQLPELSSAMYVKINYSYMKRKQLTEMVTLMIKELMNLIKAATWMDDSTKHMAEEKVKKLKYVISYDDFLINDKHLQSAFKNLKITDNLVENVINIKKVAFRHMMETLNLPLEKRNQASLLPLAHVVNAFYHPGLNSIAIPAGIAHGYIYSEKQEAYSNFGSLGIIIGHELSHIFDNVGRLYDADGRYTNWWSANSNSNFIRKSQCFIKQYNNYTLGQKFKINGTLTLGENMADSGGILLAYRAFQEWKKIYKIKKLPGLEKFTLNQLFWISVGNTWCDKLRDERLPMFLKTDVHSLGNFRVLGPLSNSEEFSKDFKCSPDSFMNRKQKCTIW